MGQNTNSNRSNAPLTSSSTIVDSQGITWTTFLWFHTTTSNTSYGSFSPFRLMRSINPYECILGNREVEYLEYIFWAKGINPPAREVQAIRDFRKAILGNTQLVWALLSKGLGYIDPCNELLKGHLPRAQGFVSTNVWHGSSIPKSQNKTRQCFVPRWHVSC